MMKNLLYIGNNLSKHGNNTTSIESLSKMLAREGFQIYCSSSIKNKIIRLLAMIFATIRLQKKVDYVLIDVYSTANFWYAFIISQLCRIFNLKYIPKLHGGNLPWRLQNNPKLCKMIFGNAYVNIAPSNYLFLPFKNFGFTNMIYIPNTIEIDNYPFKSRKKSEPKLLWVRAFDEIYNPKMAVDVLFELQKTYSKATLCMVGPDKDGSLAKTKTYANELGITVQFTGKLSKKKWVNLSQEYDIFINTTHFDNTPVSVMEAMALGLVVVSTNVGGIPFLLKHDKDSLLVDDNDTDEMVLSILKLIENQNYFQELAANARVKAESFDWKTVKHEWLKILR